MGSRRRWVGLSFAAALAACSGKGATDAGSSTVATSSAATTGNSSGASSSSSSSSSGSSSGGSSTATASSSGSAAGTSSGSSGSSDGGAPLPTGTVTSNGTVACPADAPTGAACQAITVSCPNVPDIQARIAVTQPTTAATATLVVHIGSGGTGFFNGGPIYPDGGPTGANFVDIYLDAGIRVVQIAWATDWEVSGSPGSGLLAAACRPATFFRWVFATIHGGDRALAYCGQGQSGGNGAFSYAMSHYGLGDTFDYLLLSAGPPFGRIDYGCDPSLYTGPPRDICTGQAISLSNAPLGYVDAASFLDQIEGTSSCLDAGITQATISRWAADSVVSPGAVYDYPETPIDFWYCVNQPNETTGLGSFYSESITSTHTLNCGAGLCQVEQIQYDPTSFQSMVTDMEQGCVPQHDGGA